MSGLMSVSLSAIVSDELLCSVPHAFEMCHFSRYPTE